MKTLKVLFVHHRGFYLNHLVKQLNVIMEERDVYVESLALDEAIERRMFDADVLIYHTFPGEDNPKKFNAPLVKRADEIFKGFKGIKILYDSHTEGDKDGFIRFKDSTIPRIKCNPSFLFMENFNVVHEIFTDFEGDEAFDSAMSLYDLLHDMVYPPGFKEEEPIKEEEPVKEEAPKPKKIVKKKVTKPRKILKRSK